MSSVWHGPDSLRSVLFFKGHNRKDLQPEQRNVTSDFGLLVTNQSIRQSAGINVCLPRFCKTTDTFKCNVSLHCNLMSVLFNNGGLVSAQVQAESHLVRVMRNLMIWLRILSLVATIMDGV